MSIIHNSRVHVGFLGLLITLFGLAIAGISNAVTVAGATGETVANKAIVHNGGFEKDKASWWGPGFDNGTAQVVKKHAAIGHACLKLTSGWICQDKIPIQSDKRYKVAMKIRSNGATPGSVYVQISYRGPGMDIRWYGPVLYGAEKALFVTGGTYPWKTFSAVVAPPSGANQILIYLRKKADSAGAAYFDNVTVEPTKAAVTMRKVLVVNGGFESGSANWWGPGFGKNGTALIVKKNAASGQACLKITSGWVCQDKIPLQGGKHYKVAMKIRSNGTPAGSVYVQISYRGPGVDIRWYGPAIYAGSQKALFVTGGTHPWKTFSAVVAPPSGANQILIYLRKKGGSAGAAYFDDVTCKPTKDAITLRKVIILNGDFVAGSANWWGPGLGKGAGEVVTKDAANGKACLKLNSGWVCQDHIPVQGGKRYNINMQMRCDGASERSAYVQISYRGPSVEGRWYGPRAVDTGYGSEKALFVIGGNQPWKVFSAVVEAPRNANEILLYLRKKAGSTGTACFDDIKMVPTDKPPTTATGLMRVRLAAKWLRPALPVAQAKAAIKSLLTTGAQPVPAKLNVIENGGVKYHVHIGTKASLLVLNAAHQLSKYLGKISGSPALALSYDGHPTVGPVMIVGRHNELTQKLCPNIPYASLGDDGFVIRTVGPDLVIVGATPGGTMYGVNWFLDHKLGVKWLTPNYTYVPSAKNLVIAAVRTTQVPRFAYRQILSYEGQDKAFASHNLLNGNSHGAYGLISPPQINFWNNYWERPGLEGSFYDLIPPQKYQAAHPQWYAGGQVAMMNSRMRQALANAIIKRLKGVPHYRKYYFGMMDNDWGWDMDPQSAAFAKDHGGVPSAPQLAMAISVLKRVRKVLPGAKIAFNAYHWGFKPPTGMRVPKSLLVFPMTIQVDYSTALNKGRNQALGKALAGWDAISKDVLVWDHVTNFGGFIQPTPNIYPICQSIRWLATLPNIHGYFAEGSWNTPHADFAALHVWIMARMLWNPATDYRAAISEYCNDYYGPAGPFINKYIDLMHTAAVKTGAPLWEKTNVNSAMFTLGFVTRADTLFDKAQSAVANDPILLDHVRDARVGVDYVILLRRREYADEAARRHIPFKVNFARRLARFTQTLKEEHVTEYRQSGSIKELLRLIKLKRTTPRIPKIVRNLPKRDWMTIQDLGITRYWDTAIVSDPAASDGTAIRIRGNQQAWVIQYRLDNLPKGRWNLYAAVRVDTASYQDAAKGDVALMVGSSPPMNRYVNVTVGELKKGAYQLIKVPGSPFSYNPVPSAGRSAWIHGIGNSKIKYIYVDRFVAIRVSGHTSEQKKKGTQSK